MKRTITVLALVASMATGSAEAFPKRSDIRAASEHVGFVSGRLSPLASKEFTKRDWKMFESYTIAAEQ